MRDIEWLDFEFGERALEVGYKVVQLPPTAKVVDQKKSAAQKVFFHPCQFVVGQLHVSNFAQVGERVLEQIRISEAEDVLGHIVIDGDLRELRDNFGKMLTGFGVVM